MEFFEESLMKGEAEPYFDFSDGSGQAVSRESTLETALNMIYDLSSRWREKENLAGSFILLLGLFPAFIIPHKKTGDGEAGTDQAGKKRQDFSG